MQSDSPATSSPIFYKLRAVQLATLGEPLTGPEYAVKIRSYVPHVIRYIDMCLNNCDRFGDMFDL